MRGMGNLSERKPNEEEEMAKGKRENVKDEYRERERMEDGDGGNRAITAMSSVTDLHRPLHSHSPCLLSVELLSSVAYH